MTYATVIDLLNAVQSKELMKIAAPQSATRQTLASELAQAQTALETLLQGGDMSAFSPEMQAYIQETKQAMEEALTTATQQMDSYLSSRIALPLSAETIALNPLKRICCDLARYFIAEKKFKETDEIRQRFQDAISWLKDIGSGRARLVLPILEGQIPVSPLRFISGQGVSKMNWDHF